MIKGIAIENVLLLIVGILAMLTIVFLLHKYMTAKELSIQECRARLMDICTQCSNNDFNWFPISSELTTQCSKYDVLSDWNNHDSCDSVVGLYSTKDLCARLGMT